MGKYKNLIQKRGFRSLLIAQFLGAYIDNAYRILASLLLVNLAGKESEAGSYLSSASALFIIPFILFSPYAGVMADRYSKKSVLIITKVLEVAVMILGLIGFITMNIWFILFCLFCMGLQSTFYSPAKYGILPELMTEKDLSSANGLIEMTTFLAIIIGTGSSGIFLYLFYDHLSLVAGIFIILGLVGVKASYSIDDVVPANPDRKFELNPLKTALENLRRIVGDRLLGLAILAVIFFWFMGAIIQLNIILYGKILMGINDAQTSLLCLLLALGIGTGSLLAGKLSGDKIELGLVPLGSLGIGLFVFDLSFDHPSLVRTGTDLILLGLSGGLFIVPLNTFIQQRSPGKARGQTIATANILTCTGVLGASLVLYLLNVIMDFSPARIFLFLAILAFGMTAFLSTILLFSVLRFSLRFLIRIFYRIELSGENNIPNKGGALLICNHISYLDPFLLGTGIPRMVRFVMFRKYYEIKGLQWFFKLFKAIPISEDQGPKELLRSLKRAQRELAKGHLVCIFAEGSISRTSNLLPFKKGLEKIAKNSSAPIIPVHLDGVWGSIFSFKKNKFFFKLPEKIIRPITISVGSPLAPDTPVHVIRKKIIELGAMSFSKREENNSSLPSRFIEISKKRWFRQYMTDSSGKSFSYGRSLISSLVLASLIRKKFHGDRVGILLPSSTAAVLANIATMMAGKIPVNLNYTLPEETVTSLAKNHGITLTLSSRLFIKRLKFQESPGMIFLEDCLKEIDWFTKTKESLRALFLPAWWLKRSRYLPHSSHQVATIIFSSGSTGVPKGIVLSHHNILSNISGIRQIIQLTPRDCIVGCLPFFHSLGFTGTLWLPILSNIGVVYHPNPLESQKIGELVHKHKATLIIGTPTFYNGYLRKGSREQWASMKYAVAGAEKLPQKLIASFKEKLGVTILEGYGCTELSPIVSVNVPDFNDHPYIRQTGIKIGSVGHPIPGVAVKVVNPESYSELPPDREGLLLVKGSGVMKGYLGLREETDKVIQDGWYVTGDIARVDNDGFIWITDRLSRFSKIGGEMIPHIKIEQTIHQVLQAKEPICTVISISDRKKGERLIVAHKQINVEIDDIIKGLKKLGLPPLWIPKKNHFCEMEEIPVLGSGKIDLRKIKDYIQHQFSHPGE